MNVANFVGYKVKCTYNAWVIDLSFSLLIDTNLVHSKCGRGVGGCLL